jgi:acyl carrier protein
VNTITKEQLRADLVRIIGALTTLKPTDVQDWQRLREDLGLDSLQSLEFLCRINDKYLLDLGMEDVMDMQTVGQVVSQLFLFIQNGGKKPA